MRVIRPRTARAAVRSLLVPAAVVGLLAAASPQATAHTGLDGSDPANGAVVGFLPRTITLTFSDPVTRPDARLTVTGPDGAALGDGAPTVSGRSVTLRLRTADGGSAGSASGAATAGAYTVGYRVVAADGHAVTGTSAFTVRPSAGAAATPSPRASLSRSAVASGERAATSLKAIGIGFGIGLVAMIAAMTVTVRRHRRRADEA
ncbi:copper resistance CopC family protein [Streptomyces sp. NPDC055103]